MTYLDSAPSTDPGPDAVAFLRALYGAGVREVQFAPSMLEPVGKTAVVITVVKDKPK